MSTRKLSLYWGGGGQEVIQKSSHWDRMMILRSKECKHKIELFEIMDMIGSSGEVNWDNTVINTAYQYNN